MPRTPFVGVLFLFYFWLQTLVLGILGFIGLVVHRSLFLVQRSSLIVQRTFYKKTNINMSPHHKQKIFNNYNNFCPFSAPSTKFSKKSAHLNF